MDKPKDYTIATMGRDGRLAIIARTEHHDVQEVPSQPLPDRPKAHTKESTRHKSR